MNMQKPNPTTTGHTLVSSADVDGTKVYSRSGDSLGHIDHLMIDKASGRVAYAVMHFGGFLGIGEEAHPVPWDKLTYDPAEEGFVTDLTAEAVKGAPRRDPDWYTNRRYQEDLHQHYGLPPYWML